MTIVLYIFVRLFFYDILKFKQAIGMKNIMV